MANSTKANLRLYSKTCLKCVDKPLWSRIKAYAKANDLALFDIRTTYSTELQDRANELRAIYGVREPFIYLEHEDRAIEAHEL